MRRKINPWIVIIGIVLAVLAAAGIWFILPNSFDPAMRRIIFFMVVIAVYFFVTLIGHKIRHR